MLKGRGDSFGSVPLMSLLLSYHLNAQTRDTCIYRHNNIVFIANYSIQTMTEDDYFPLSKCLLFAGQQHQVNTKQNN